MDINAATLAARIDTAEWQWLRAHNERGALIIVDNLLELPVAGEKIAADDAKTVQAWLAASLIKKPDAEQIAIWDATPAKPFRMLVISPFILIQEEQQ